jgi:hypothetical protein
MNLKFKKEKSSYLKIPQAVPVTEEMKRELDQLKKRIDINQMTRDFWADIVKKAKSA